MLSSGEMEALAGYHRPVPDENASDSDCAKGERRIVGVGEVAAHHRCLLNRACRNPSASAQFGRW